MTHFRIVARLAVGVLLLGVIIPQVQARTVRSATRDQVCVTCLGKPVEVTSPLDHFPLDNFHGIHTSLRQFGRPELLVIGVVNDESTNLEQWPLVKALDQFGVWSRVRAVDNICTQEKVAGRGTYTICNVPTLDLSHAVFRSRYLVLVHKYVASFDFRHLHRLQHLTTQEQSLFQRYSCGASKLNCFGGHVTINEPLEVVDNYVQISSQFVLGADFYRTLPSTSIHNAPSAPLNYDAIHSALVAGANPAPGTNLIVDINAEANILTALICHADGKRPSGVCRRPAIRQILKSVR